MKPLKITLRDKNGETQTYTQNFVPLQKTLDAADLNDRASDYNTEVEWITAKLEYVAGLFDAKEVTAKAILQGIDAREGLTVVDRLINEVMGLTDPNSETPKAEE